MPPSNVDARLHEGTDASAIGLAYHVLNCAAVTLKADASVENANKFTCR